MSSNQKLSVSDENGHNNSRNPRFYFFGGKGGVGKTSISCAAALSFAKKGKKTLLVSLDSTPHIGDVFQQDVGKVTSNGDVIPKQCHQNPNLYLAEVDPSGFKIKDEIQKYLVVMFEKAGMSEKDAKTFAKSVCPCESEIAATMVLGNFIIGGLKTWDVVIFDTAPTGKTLALFDRIVEDTKYYKEKAKSYPDDAIIKMRKEINENLWSLLRDKSRTTFVLILFPETLPIIETKDTIEILKNLGIKTQYLVVNYVLAKELSVNPEKAYLFIKKRSELQQKHIKDIEESFKEYPIIYIPLLENEIIGLTSIEKLIEKLEDFFSDTEVI